MDQCILQKPRKLVPTNNSSTFTVDIRPEKTISVFLITFLKKIGLNFLLIFLIFTSVINDKNLVNQVRET